MPCSAGSLLSAPSAERPEQEENRRLETRVQSKAVSPRRARAWHGDPECCGLSQTPAFSHQHPKASVREKSCSKNEDVRSPLSPEQAVCQDSRRSPPLPGHPWPALVSLCSP